MINISPAEYLELDALIKLGCRVFKRGEKFVSIIIDGDKAVETASDVDLSKVIKQTSAHSVVRKKANASVPSKPSAVLNPQIIYQ